MTTELEQEFFKVFGVEPKIYETDGRDIDDNGDVCSWYIEEVYPEITDRKLLEMICILSQSYPLNYEGWSFYTVQELKETMLEDCIKTAKKLSLSSDFVNKIQQLFKEGE